MNATGSPMKLNSAKAMNATDGHHGRGLEQSAQDEGEHRWSPPRRARRGRRRRPGGDAGSVDLHPAEVEAVVRRRCGMLTLARIAHGITCWCSGRCGTSARVDLQRLARSSRCASGRRSRSSPVSISASASRVAVACRRFQMPSALPCGSTVRIRLWQRVEAVEASGRPSRAGRGWCRNFWIFGK